MGYLKRVVYNCRRATLLIEKRLIDRLTFREHIELRVHLIQCSVCKLYNKQSSKINEMVQQLFHSSMDKSIRLDDNFKEELQQRIEEELNKN